MTERALDWEVVVFKQVLPGDLRKAEAHSADSGTGGGARDLRFPYKGFAPAMRKMFPRVSTEQTRNGGEIRVGTVRWREENRERQTEVEYWAPTDARPAEGRIARVPEIPPLANYPTHDPDGEPLILLLILDTTGTFLVRYVPISRLRRHWDSDVYEPVSEALAGARSGRAALGWIDRVTGARYTSG